MDFDSLKKNMLEGKFTTMDSFLADFQLIWDNCKLYNMQGSEIYKLCEKMEKVSKRELHKFKTQYGYQDLELPTKNGSKLNGPSRTSRRNNVKGGRGDSADQMAGMGTYESGSGKQDEQMDAEAVSREQKLEFVSKIKKLSNQGLTQMVNKIKAVKAQSIADLPEEKIQIRVDDFDKNEFTQINEFVDEILQNELPSKRQKIE